MSAPDADQENLHIRFGVFELDKRSRSLWKNNRKNRLTISKQMFDTLCLLIERRERVVGHHELLNRLRQSGYVTMLEGVYTLVSKLRQSIGDKWIETLPAVGYRFTGEVIEVDNIDASTSQVVRIAGLPAASRQRRWGALKNELMKLCASRFRELHVVDGPQPGPSMSQWEEAVEHCAPEMSVVLQSAIIASDIIALTWGRTLYYVIENLAELNLRTPWSKTRKEFVPLWGQALGPCMGPHESRFRNPNDVSSSRLVARLNRIVNGRDSEQRLTLNAVPEFVPLSFPRDRREDSMEIVFEFLETIDSYAAIFGPSDQPYVEKLHTIITSAGDPDQPGLFWATGAVMHGGIDPSKLKERVIGDIGGALIAKNDGDQYVEQLSKRWTGVKLQHFRNCAEQAEINGTRGVILVAVGATRKQITLESVRRGYVNELVIDSHLAEALQSELQASADSKAIV